MSPSQACGAETTGPVGVSVVPQLSVRLVVLARRSQRYNQRYATVVGGAGEWFELYRYGMDHSLVSCLRNPCTSRCK